MKEIQNQFPGKIELINLDITKEEDIQKSVAAVTEKSGGKIDLLLNCSAILHPSGKGETSLRDVSFHVLLSNVARNPSDRNFSLYCLEQGLRNTFETNSIGPLLIAKYYSPLLVKSSGLFGSQIQKKHSGILINMSAKVSSIAGICFNLKKNFFTF